MLRSRGMRVTTVRMAVLNALCQQEGPRTHEQIMTDLAGQAYDKASVWRVLSDLAGKGFVRRMDLGDRIWRYELLHGLDAIEPSHAHFLCIACGHVACLPPIEIRTKTGEFPEVLQQALFSTRFEGTCGQCRAGGLCKDWNRDVSERGDPQSRLKYENECRDLAGRHSIEVSCVVAVNGVEEIVPLDVSVPSPGAEPEITSERCMK